MSSLLFKTFGTPWRTQIVEKSTSARTTLSDVMLSRGFSRTTGLLYQRSLNCQPYADNLAVRTMIPDLGSKADISLR